MSKRHFIELADRIRDFEKCNTWEEAEAGHARMLAKVLAR